MPFWSADLTSTNSEKTYYAADREHNGAYDYEKNAVEKEGLLSSENTIQMVKNIIDGKQNVLPNGITKTRPQE